jgi:hypothetical protein
MHTKEVLILSAQAEQVSSRAELKSHHLPVAQFFADLRLVCNLNYSFFDEVKGLYGVLTLSQLLE